MLTRRRFSTSVAGLMAASALRAPALARAAPKVVVIGGGAGGASAVRRLSEQAGEALDVTLVEPQRSYTTCFCSSLYLAGLWPIDALRFSYAALARRPGVTLAADRARGVDMDRRLVRLEGGQTLSYDRLVMSPGISLDYDSLPGWSREVAETLPHAWSGGGQLALLKRQLDAVPDGGLIVVVSPSGAYRCPPAPYERVSLMAHALQSTGRTQARIVILDAKEKFAMQALFQHAWERRYPGMIEWTPPMIHAGIKSVSAETMTVETDFESYRDAALINVIPSQTAGRVAVEAGLADETGYCPIDPFTMRSRLDPMIFVLGDSALAGEMPKSAFGAHSQAQSAAAAILEDLLAGTGTGAGAGAAYVNKCWSVVGPEDGVFVSERYRATPEKIERVESALSGLQDSAATRRANYGAMAAWFAQFTKDMFG